MGMGLKNPLELKVTPNEKIVCGPPQYTQK